MRFAISEHQCCAYRPPGTCKEYQTNQSRFRVHSRQLDRHDPAGFLPRLNPGRTDLALCYVYRNFSIRLQTRRLVRTQLKALEGVERLSIPGSFECHYLWGPGHVGFLGSVPNGIADEDLPVVFEQIR